MAQSNDDLASSEEKVTSHSPTDDVVRVEQPSLPSKSTWRKVYDKLSYVPPRCRYNPDKPFEFSMGLNILFGKSTREI
jgi:hypothetical protein